MGVPTLRLNSFYLALSFAWHELRSSEADCPIAKRKSYDFQHLTMFELILTGIHFADLVISYFVVDTEQKQQ
jgi:hypothetical protein